MIHVSVFISVEFLDKDPVSFLKQYGQLRTEKFRRLYYSDEGYANIKRGICVAEFVSLDRDLPRKLVTQGLEIFLKYSGEPVLLSLWVHRPRRKGLPSPTLRDHESHVRRNPGETQRPISPPPLPLLKPPWTQKYPQQPTHLRLPILHYNTLKRLPHPKQHHRLVMLTLPTPPRSPLLVLRLNLRVSMPTRPRLKASSQRRKNPCHLRLLHHCLNARKTLF